MTLQLLHDEIYVETPYGRYSMRLRCFINSVIWRNPLIDTVARKEQYVYTLRWIIRAY